MSDNLNDLYAFLNTGEKSLVKIMRGVLEGTVFEIENMSVPTEDNGCDVSLKMYNKGEGYEDVSQEKREEIFGDIINDIIRHYVIPELDKEIEEKNSLDEAKE